MLGTLGTALGGRYVKRKLGFGKKKKPKVEKYDAYKQGLHELTRSDRPLWRNAKIICLPRRVGFGLALRHGLGHVATNFVRPAQRPH